MGLPEVEPKKKSKFRRRLQRFAFSQAITAIFGTGALSIFLIPIFATLLAVVPLLLWLYGDKVEVDTSPDVFQYNPKPPSVPETSPAPSTEPAYEFDQNGNEAQLIKASGLVMPNRSQGKGRISSFMGFRSDPFAPATTAFHAGVDIPGYENKTPIYAVQAGTVVKAACGVSGYGCVIFIQHTAKTDGTPLTYYSVYGHMNSKKYITVTEGQTVAQNDIIGYVGNNGKSTGAHVHFEIRLPNNSDPKVYASTVFQSYGTKSNRQYLVDPITVLPCKVQDHKLLNKAGALQAYCEGVTDP